MPDASVHPIGTVLEQAKQHSVPRLCQRRRGCVAPDRLPSPPAARILDAPAIQCLPSMPKTIDYYFSPMSPWTYLGHERLVALARKHGASIDPKPVDYGKIFPASGGLPLAKR